jgi:probable HAF family extracellular repeat protein
VGQTQTTGGNNHAFLYSGGIMIDLGTLPGYSSSFAAGINAAGQVVGYSDTNFSISYHAFLYSGGIMTDLGTLGGPFSFAGGINDAGQIVGYSATAGNPNAFPWCSPACNYDAFLYSGGIMTDLNSLLPANSGWQLEFATAINNSGQIAGTGFINGQQHAYLLDTASTPEPTSLALLGAGAALLILIRKRLQTS